MLVNSSLTVYHKAEIDHDYKWVRYNYGDKSNNKVWFYGGKGSSLNKGYAEANDVQIRIPYDLNPNLDYNNFAIEDILVQGEYEDIVSENDLKDLNIPYYNITSLNNNVFGNDKHIHIGGK